MKTLSLNPCNRCGTKEEVRYIFGLEAWICEPCKIAEHEHHFSFTCKCETCWIENLLLKAK